MKSTEDIRDALELAIRTLKNAAQEADARLVEQEKEIERLRAAARPYTREQLLATPLVWSRTYEGPARSFNLGEACYRAWGKPAYKQAEDAAVALYWEHRERQAQAQLIAAGRENEIPYIAPADLGKVRNEDGWRILRKGEVVVGGDEVFVYFGCSRWLPCAGSKGAIVGVTFPDGTYRRKVEAAMPLIGAGYRALKTGEQVLEGDENYIGAGVWSPCTIHYSVRAQLGYFVPLFGEGFYRRRVDDPFIPDRFQGRQGFFRPGYRVLGKGEVVKAGDEYCHPVAAGLGWFPIDGLSWCIGRHVGEVVRDAWRRKK